MTDCAIVMRWDQSKAAGFFRFSFTQLLRFHFHAGIFTTRNADLIVVFLLVKCMIQNPSFVIPTCNMAGQNCETQTPQNIELRHQLKRTSTLQAIIWMNCKIQFISFKYIYVQFPIYFLLHIRDYVAMAADSEKCAYESFSGLSVSN